MELVSIKYSPWSERIKFFLDQFHGVFDYKVIEYDPATSEPYLRYRMGKLSTYFTEKVTVPVMFFKDGSYIADSFAIYEYICKQYPGSNPGGINTNITKPEHVEKLMKIKDLNNRICEAGRVRMSKRTANSPEVVAAATPFPLNYTGPIGRAVVRVFMRKFLNKYIKSEYVNDDASFKIMKDSLEELCQVANIGKEFSYVIPELGFTYADILVANSLAMVLPHEKWCNLEALLVPCWTEPELAKIFPDLIAYRDRLYELHRAPASNKLGT